MTILAGSLKTHWIRYVTELNLDINPTCQRSMALGNRMINTLYQIDSKFLQPGFTHTYLVGENIKTYNQPSIMQLKFVNGY